MAFELFVPLAKVAPHKREVTGILTHEMPDHDGEIMDYDSSKPYFMAWSSMVHQDSSGKSLGNLRIMHQPKVGGKLTNMDFDDHKKLIRVTAKVTDNEEWKKVMNGEYTGFSVGGNYVDKWEDPQVLSSGKKAVRFTADPYEASLVDRPSVPSALFESMKMIKMVSPDGREEDIPLTELAARAEGKPLAFDADSVESEDAVLKALLDDFAKRIRRRKDTKPDEGVHQYGDVEFADETNKKYPIDTEEHIRAAWNYINKEKDQSKYSPAEVAEIKSKIIAVWKRKIDAKGPPSAREGKKAATPEEVRKGLMRAGQLAMCIEQLGEFAQGQIFEDMMEGQEKPSKVPKKVYNALKDLMPVLLQYIEEEGQELITQVAEATSSEATKMSGNAAGDTRLDTLTKGISDLVGLLKAAKEDDDAEKRRKAEEAEKARKAKEEGDADEDEAEKGISEDEKKARKERNEKRKEKREKAEKEKKEKAAGSSSDVDTLTKSVEDLLKVNTELADQLNVVKGVVLMQATEIQKLSERSVRKGAPLLTGGGDKFNEAYLKAMGKQAGSGEDFASALKGIYAQARGQA